MDCDIDGDIDVEADAELDIESEMVSPEKKVVFLLSLNCKLRFELPQSRQRTAQKPIRYVTIQDHWFT